MPRAKGNKIALKSRQIVLANYFLFDLKLHSINAQRSAGTLIDKEQLRLDLLAFILELKDHDSTHSISLLTNSVCSEKAGEICTVKEFLVSTKVTFKDEKLTKDKFSIDFINLREKFCLSLHNDVKSFSPENKFKYFEIFVPKKMPRTVVKLIHTVIRKIQTIAYRFSLNPTTASKEWINLLISVVQKNGYCTLNKLNI